MLGKGFMSPEMVAGAQSKLEGAIEELREKYAKIAEVKAAEDAEKARIEKLNDKEEQKKQALIDAQAVDMSMADPEMEALRQSRLAALKQATKSRTKQLADGHGELHEIVEEDFLKEVTSTKYVVCHFFHQEFITCKVMDKHLRILAPQVLTAKFVRINAERAPFFVTKLKVKMLPSVIMFQDGVMVGRQTGFEGLVSEATEEDFPTYRLKRVLRACGMMGDNSLLAGAGGGGAAAAGFDDDYSDDDGAGGEGGANSGSAGDFAAQLARARRAMLESMDDDF